MSNEVQNVDGQTESTGTQATVATPKRTYQRTGVTKDQILGAYHDVKYNTLSDVASALGMKVSTLGVRLTGLRKAGLLTRELARAAKKPKSRKPGCETEQTEQAVGIV